MNLLFIGDIFASVGRGIVAERLNDLITEHKVHLAIANAENNHQLDVDRLFVKEATVGRAFVLKRFHTRGRGRSARVEKMFAHLTVIVEERAEEIE